MKSLLTFALVSMLAAASSFAADGPVRHIVAFKFKADADPKAIAKIVEDFGALRAKIPLIQNLEWGTNISTENHDKGMTHCWIVSFKDAKDCSAYLVDPAHKAFVAELKDVMDDAFVFDFIPKP
jgi:hypothetical protein